MHPTAQLALTARIDGFVRFWNVSSGMPSGPVLACGAPVLFAEFVEGGSKVVTGDDGDLIRIWDAKTGREVQSAANFSPGISGMSLNVDHNLILVGGSGVAQRWTVKPLQPSGEIMMHNKESSEDSVLTAISPNASRLLTCGEDGFAKLWDSQGQLIAVLPHQNRIRGGAFSPDNQWVATVSDDRTAKIWDGRTGEHSSTLTHSGEVFSVAFVSSHLLVTGSQIGTQLWDHTFGRRIGPPCFTGEITMSLATSSDRTTVIMGDWDGIGLIWMLPKPLRRSSTTLLRSIEADVGLRLDDARGKEVLSGTDWLNTEQLARHGEIALDSQDVSPR